MTDINVDAALWATAMLPEGILERWFVTDGELVVAGQRIAELRIEDALHDIMAPASGRLSIVAARNAVVEPGSVVATVA
jgi:pyruvate/2-oxoglutarate dehydrogenase complex dihydrolipoamide acyltransferase (E2) component